MPAKPKTKAKPGVKPKIIDYDAVSKLAAMNCTEGEIADYIGYTKDGFIKRKKQDDQLVEVLRVGQSKGKISLRREQWKLAQQGNPTMCIWLGKQLLGQKDKAEVDQNVSIEKDVRDLTDNELLAIINRKNKRD